MLVNFIPNINCVNHLPLFPCDIQHIRLRNYICLKYKIFSRNFRAVFFSLSECFKEAVQCFDCVYKGQESCIVEFVIDVGAKKCIKVILRPLHIYSHSNKIMQYLFESFTSFL